MCEVKVRNRTNPNACPCDVGSEALNLRVSVISIPYASVTWVGLGLNIGSNKKKTGKRRTYFAQKVERIAAYSPGVLGDANDLM